MEMEPVCLPELNPMELWLDSVRFDADPQEGLEEPGIHDKWRSVLLADICRNADDSALCYALTGSPGMAGGDLAEACAGTLVQSGYRCFQALGVELEGDTPAETQARLNALLSQSAALPACFIISYIDDCENPKAIYRQLTVHLRRSIREKRRMAFFLLSQKEEEIPASLRGLLQVIPLKKPTDSQRQNLMEQLMDDAFGFGCRLNLVEKTEGFDYYQMYDLINSANNWYSSQYARGIMEAEQSCTDFAAGVAELLQQPKEQPQTIIQTAVAQPFSPVEPIDQEPSVPPTPAVWVDSDGDPMPSPDDILNDNL